MKNAAYSFSDKEYGRVLDNFVVACVDVAVIYKDQILLENRTKHPDKGGWWIFGGRVHVGESLQETAMRGLERELGMKVGYDRIIKMGTYNLLWPIRREPTNKNGCHHLLVAHGIILTGEEYKTINNYILNNSIKARWFSLSDLEQELTEPNIKLLVSECKELVEAQANIPF